VKIEWQADRALFITTAERTSNPTPEVHNLPLLCILRRVVYKFFYKDSRKHIRKILQYSFIHRKSHLKSEENDHVHRKMLVEGGVLTLLETASLNCLGLDNGKVYCDGIIHY
jgi:hypothetical protein